MLSKNSLKHKKPSLESVLYILEEVNTLPIFGSEPMYELNEKNIKKIESALEIPFVSFFGEEKYKTIEEKAASIIYFVSKNHVFPNGNKRTAVILMLLFLAENGKWTTFSSKELYDFSLEITSSPDKNHEEKIREIARILKGKIKDFE